MFYWTVPFFVIGPENMSKLRFIIMSMMPNLILGFMPYVFFWIFPDHVWIGLFGAVAIGMGVGDYYDVFLAIAQVPHGGRIYLRGWLKYWYMPKE